MQPNIKYNKTTGLPRRKREYRRASSTAISYEKVPEIWLIYRETIKINAKENKK